MPKPSTMCRAQDAAGSLLDDALPDVPVEGEPLADADADGAGGVDDDPHPEVASTVAHETTRTAVARRRTTAWSHGTVPRAVQPLTASDARRKAATTAGGSRTAM
jgi:hypothetical protein